MTMNYKKIAMLLLVFLSFHTLDAQSMYDFYGTDYSSVLNKKNYRVYFKNYNQLPSRIDFILPGGLQTRSFDILENNPFNNENFPLDSEIFGVKKYKYSEVVSSGNVDDTIEVSVDQIIDVNYSSESYISILYKTISSQIEEEIEESHLEGENNLLSTSYKVIILDSAGSVVYQDSAQGQVPEYLCAPMIVSNRYAVFIQFNKALSTKYLSIYDLVSQSSFLELSFSSTDQNIPNVIENKVFIENKLTSGNTDIKCIVPEDNIIYSYSIPASNSSKLHSYTKDGFILENSSFVTYSVPLSASEVAVKPIH